MKLYVISTQHLQLVSINTGKTSELFNQKSINQQDVRSVFNASQKKEMIALENKKEACLVARLFIDDATAMYMEGDIRLLLACPVIFEVDIDETKCEAATELSVGNLLNYQSKCNVSFPQFYESEQQRYSEGLSNIAREVAHPIRARKITGLTLESIDKAYYTNAKTNQLVEISLRSRLFEVFGCLLPSCFLPDANQGNGKSSSFRK